MITYEEFEKHMKDIVDLIRFEDSIESLSREYNKNREKNIEMKFPTLVDNVILLLQKLTGDKEDWIYYWLYELDCGEDYKEGYVTDANGNNIELKTIRDLWDLLNESAPNDEVLGKNSHKPRKCPNCGSVTAFNSYFNAYICYNCGWKS